MQVRKIGNSPQKTISKGFHLRADWTKVQGCKRNQDESTGDSIHFKTFSKNILG